jgi:hypothetical protein
MKKTCLFIFVLAIGLVPSAQSEIIFLDNYEGMSVNDPLAGLLRTPTIGPSGTAGWISAVGEAGAQVVAGLDGKAAGVNVPMGGAIDYLADLKQEYGGERFLLEWDIVVNRVGSDPGLFAVRFPTPANSMQILFGFMNDGRLIRFNADPSPNSLVQVGAFTETTRYAVGLTYDLVSDRYSVALNGLSVITDQPIPAYLDAVSIDRFGFDINQTDIINLNNQIPQGNSYLVDNVRFSRTTPVPEPGALLLIAGGMAGIFALRRKIRRPPSAI